MDTQIGKIAPPALERAFTRQHKMFPEHGEALDWLLAYLRMTRPTMTEIKASISEFYAMQPGELMGRGRHYQTCLARQMFCYLAHKYTRFSMRQIGAQVGLRHHTTVMHAVRKMERYAITKPLIADDLDLLRMRISEKVLLRTKGAA